MIERLSVWRDARSLVVDLYKLLANNKDYGFKDQLQRAAVSIMNNIAEGQGYGSNIQFAKYLHISLGSCYEVKSMLYLCSDLNYCTEETSKLLIRRVDKLSIGISRLIAHLTGESKDEKRPTPISEH